ncbi:hypothetical protein RB195_014288 [Necator americanus]|uniref:Uncharacterized protein n=2 Tax=Necator americanus TaxID=51031 RepID=A0ABR1DZE5_NECAM|nr:hypothetical protein NECAME_13679 [Necator americanus]ETN72951.1 hypothetical protein NECAME_13679 [Necator americanus]
MSTNKSTSFLSHFFSGVDKSQGDQGIASHIASPTTQEDLSLSSSKDKINTGSSQSLHQRGVDWGHRERLLRLAFVFDTNNY